MFAVLCNVCTTRGCGEAAGTEDVCGVGEAAEGADGKDGVAGGADGRVGARAPALVDEGEPPEPIVLRFEAVLRLVAEEAADGEWMRAGAPAATTDDAVVPIKLKLV